MSKHEKISINAIRIHQKSHLLWKFPTLQIYLLLYQLKFHQTKVKRQKSHITEIQQDVATNTDDLD